MSNLLGAAAIANPVALLANAAAFAGPIATYVGQRDANEANRDIANQATATNVAEAQRNREFQENMSNTAWQRGVEDMRRAGINPMLAINQGGASAPSGSTGSAVTSKMENQFAGAVSSAGDFARLASELSSANASRDLIKAQAATESTKQLLNTSSAASAQVGADLDRTRNDALNRQMKAITMEAAAREKEAAFDYKFGEADAYMKRIGAGAGIINDASSVLLKGRGLNVFGSPRPRPNSKYGTFSKKTGEIYE